MAYDTSPDAFDEYLQIAERTSRECLDHFTKCIHVLYYDKFLRRPTATDIQKTEEKHGLPGMLGSIDCMHWDWKNYPKSLHGQFKRSTNKYPTTYVRSSPECPFVVNGHTYRKCYYLADGIYPAWSTFVKTFSVARDEKTLKFKRVQEAVRKDIERAFGVLQVQLWRCLPIFIHGLVASWNIIGLFFFHSFVMEPLPTGRIALDTRMDVAERVVRRRNVITQMVVLLISSYSLVDASIEGQSDGGLGASRYGLLRFQVVVVTPLLGENTRRNIMDIITTQWCLL
ncbi:ALP1-like protein isoform X1 [Tanacetum coccineum]